MASATPAGFWNTAYRGRTQKIETATVCYGQTNQMPHVLDKGYRPKAITGNLPQKFTILGRTEQNLSVRTEFATKNRYRLSVLDIGNFPEDDVRRDVLAESCKESLRFETPDVFAVCSLCYEYQRKRLAWCMTEGRTNS